MFRVTDTAAAKQAREQGHGVYAIDWKTAEERINREKAIVTDTNQQMDPERLQALKEVYNENKGEEPIILRARLLEKLQQTGKPVRISDLSIGVADAEGNLLQANQVSTDDRVYAGDYLAFIMQEYRRVISPSM